MLPTSVEGHSIPPQAGKTLDPPERERIHFITVLNPFIQLLLAIGNAILIPSFFVFKEGLKGFDLIRNLFSQTAAKPVGVPQQSDAILNDAALTPLLPRKVELVDPKVVDSADLDDYVRLEADIAQVEKEARLLDQGFKTGYLVVDHAKALERIDLRIQDALHLLQKKNPTSASLNSRYQEVSDQIDLLCKNRKDEVLAHFHTMLGTLAKVGEVLPLEISQEIVYAWEVLSACMLERAGQDPLTSGQMQQKEAIEQLIEKIEFRPEAVLEKPEQPIGASLSTEEAEGDKAPQTEMNLLQKELDLLEKLLVQRAAHKQSAILDTDVPPDDQESEWLMELIEHHRSIKSGAAAIAKIHQKLEKKMKGQVADGDIKDYAKISDAFDTLCLKYSDQILNELCKILELYAKRGGHVPRAVSSELFQAWTDLSVSLLDRLSKLKGKQDLAKQESKVGRIQKLIAAFDRKDVSKSSADQTKPLKLKNIGNSCYLDSVLQMLACVDKLRLELSEPLYLPDDTDQEIKDKKNAIHEEIVKILGSPMMSGEEELSYTGFVLSLLGNGPSMQRLRETVFRSGLDTDFDDMNRMNEQHDAAAFMDMMIELFLPSCRFKIQQYASVKEFPGLHFNTAPEDMARLQIPLRDPKFRELKSLVHWVMHNRYEREADPNGQRSFDPKEGIIVDDVKGALSRGQDPQKVGEYIQWYKFKALPPVLAFQFQRSVFKSSFAGGPAYEQIDDRPVEFPDDGIIDLSKYYDASAEGPQSALYRIKGFVAHEGETVQKGHYTAYVERNGKYYCCDDLDPLGYKEIQPRAFFSRRNPYLLILERMSD